MRRTAEENLANWASQAHRKPLVLRGARQTGKTWLIQHFARSFQGDLAYINLERDPEMERCFGPSDPRAILGLLEARLGRTITPGKSLLFLDEVQSAPSIIAKLRWFAEEVPTLHLIAAGSLLDFALADHSFSMPVGRITYGHLAPMTFSEFLWACGEDRLVDRIRACTPVDGIAEVLHDRLLSLIRDYALVGGMPAAVNEWIASRSHTRTSALHRDLIHAMRDDFAKYKRGVNTAQLAKVFAALPRFVGRKFQPAAIDPDEKSLPLKNAFAMLALARLVTPVARTAANGVPLGAEVDGRYQKVCLLDVGLYTTMLGMDALEVTEARDLTLVHEGQLAEQLVGQELLASRPFNQEPALFTWVREAKNSNAEVDYVTQVGTRVVPIEVKAGATGRLRSLHMMVLEKKLDSAVRVSAGPLRLDDVATAIPGREPQRFRLLSIPFYLVSEIPRLVALAGRAGSAEARP